MMSNYKILALIPARGGSKSIPQKNIYSLCGRPLIEYTFDSAKNSEYINRIIVSTDCNSIAMIAKNNNIEVPYMRPPELAKDETPALPVIQHMLEYLDFNENYRPDIVVLLQPTSPLRTSKHIDEAIKIFISSNADSVVSVVSVPHNFNPVSVMKIEEEQLVPYMQGEGNSILRRQDKPQVYARNGAAIYVIKYDTITKKNDLFGDHCCPYVMNQEESVDIDTSFDMQIAEMIIAKRGEK